MKLLKLILILLLPACLTAQVPDSLKYKSLDPYYFHLNYLKEDKALLIDVREFFEYKKSRIRDAVNIPSSGKTEVAADTISKNCHLFFYCTTDYRSKRVALKFYDLGFTHIYNLEGGLREWEKEGMVVDKKKMKKKDQRK